MAFNANRYLANKRVRRIREEAKEDRRQATAEQRYSGYGATQNYGYGYGYYYDRKNNREGQLYRGGNGFLSKIAGRAKGSISAIGFLLDGARAAKQSRDLKKIQKGKKPYEVVEVSLLWQDRYVGDHSSFVRIPVELSLFCLDAEDSDYDSRYTLKIGKAKPYPIKGQDALNSILAEVEDGMACCLNFDIRKGKNDRLAVVEDTSFDVKDQWALLQSVSEAVQDYAQKLDDWYEREGISNESADYSRLSSSMLAAVAESARFASACTVDCKQSIGGDDYSWCVTDVALKGKGGLSVVVRVDLLHYMVEIEGDSGFGGECGDVAGEGDTVDAGQVENAEGVEAEVSSSGIGYYYAVGGLDLFDGRQKAVGSGVFTGWSGAREHLEFIEKGMAPVSQAKLGKNGKPIKIPFITNAVTNYRNDRRIYARRERRLRTYADKEDTEVFWRNLIWYNTNSKPGKITLRILPVCLLVTYPNVDGIIDKDVAPIAVGYNILPVETEYVCCEEDIQLYAEEVEQGVSFLVNLGIAEKDGRFFMRKNKLTSITDDWEKLQALTGAGRTIIDQLTESVAWWTETATEVDFARFDSAVFAGILLLAGYVYARPTATEDGTWSVTDVALTRPHTKKGYKSGRFSHVLAEYSNSANTFTSFMGNNDNLLKRMVTDTVMVRVDIHADPVTYGYVEEAVQEAPSKPVISDLRQGCEEFTGWDQDVDYQLRKHKAEKSAASKAKQQRTKVITRDKKLSTLMQVSEADRVPEVSQRVVEADTDTKAHVEATESEAGSVEKMEL